MFKVDQPVWCVMFGKGVVSKISTGKTKYPLVVEFLGKKVEGYTLDGKFMVYAAQTLFPYPVEINQKISKPSVNWDHVNSRYNYLAQDGDGSCWLYENEPFIVSGDWASSRGDCTPADCLQSLVLGTCHWFDSLVERPTGNSGDNR